MESGSVESRFAACVGKADKINGKFMKNITKCKWIVGWR